MMQTVGDLLSNDSRASHSSSSASPLLGRGKNKGSKSPFSLLSEPISPSSLLFDFLIQVHPVQFPLLPTFLFLPPPYFFPLFLPPPNLFWAISPSSLFCSSPSVGKLLLRICPQQTTSFSIDILVVKPLEVHASFNVDSTFLSLFVEFEYAHAQM